jgi:hypothetical protein
MTGMKHKTPSATVRDLPLVCRQNGTVAVTVALSLSVFLMLIAFVLDTGYLYSEKNRYYNAVEAAALAGAASLCDADPVEVATEIALENGLSGGSLVVKAGFYDEKEVYADFAEYSNFVAEGEDDYPEGEYNNAVMVGLTVDQKTLTGGFAGRDEVTLAATGVAYARDYGMVSLDEEDGISLEGSAPLLFHDGDIHARGGIKKAGSCSFVNASLHPYSAATQEIRPMDDETLGRLRAEDEVEDIGPSDAGTHPVFWKNDPYALFYPSGAPFVRPQALTDAFDSTKLPLKPPPTGWGLYPSADAYYIDLSRLSEGSKVFFDAGDRKDVLAIIYLENPNPPPSEPVQGITFMANCPVLVQGKDSYSFVDSSHYGGEGERRVTIISSKTIALKTANVYTHGVFFWTGGDFGVYGVGGSSPHTGDMAKVVATGAIKVENYTKKEVWGFLFSAPCAPPFPLKLGRLERSSQGG